MPSRVLPRLVVADAGVDDHGEAGRSQDKAVDAHEEAPARVHEMRREPVANATVTDNSLPNPAAAVTTLWTQTSGTGTATFGNASTIDTSVTFSATGTYVLRLDANDSEFSAYDEITIEVVEGSLNSAPVVNAGNNKTITEPTTSTLLDATVNDDGKPIPPGAVTTTWTQQSGPAGVTFNNIHIG